MDMVRVIKINVLLLQCYYVDIILFPLYYTNAAVSRSREACLLLATMVHKLSTASSSNNLLILEFLVFSWCEILRSKHTGIVQLQ